MIEGLLARSNLAKLRSQLHPLHNREDHLLPAMKLPGCDRNQIVETDHAINLLAAPASLAAHLQTRLHRIVVSQCGSYLLQKVLADTTASTASLH